MPKAVEATTVIDVEPQQVKTNLLGFSASKLGDFFEEIGEKRFRATQPDFCVVQPCRLFCC